MHAHHPTPVPRQVAYEHPEKTGHPDGIPHDVIGMLAYGIALLAGATLITWLWLGVWAALAVAFVAGFFMLKGLPSRSVREREQEVPAHVAEHLHKHEHAAAAHPPMPPPPRHHHAPPPA